MGGKQAALLRQKLLEEIAQMQSQLRGASGSPGELELRLPDPPPQMLWDDYPKLSPPLLVISDLHVPYHDIVWIQKVGQKALNLGVRRLLIAGDIVDSKRVSRWVGEDGLKLDEELDIAKKLIEALKEHFEIHISLGNHDDRLAMKLDREIRTEVLLERWLGVPVYRHHQVEVGETWMVVHPVQYSRQPAQPALSLTAKYEKNVAIAHTHKFSVARSLSGKHWAIEIGSCMDTRYVEYLHRRLTTFPVQQLGALIIDGEERPIPLHPDMGGW